MTPILTVIVPVYNVRAYLAKCIDSVWNASLSCAHLIGRDVEIIAVDDGAKDGSGSLLDDYAMQLEDQNVSFKVLHQQNGGVSSARNNGLDHAHGKWVHFVDADDWVADNLYADVMQAVTSQPGADMYAFTTTWLNIDGSVAREFGANVEDRTFEGDALMDSEKYVFFAGCIWNKIYRREVIESAHLRFLLGVQPAEDDLFNMLYLTQGVTIHIIPQIKGYFYRASPGSAVHTMNVRKKMYAADQFSGLYHRWLEIRTPGLKKKLRVLARHLVFLGARTTREGREACIDALLKSRIFTCETVRFMLLYGDIEDRVFATIFLLIPKACRHRYMLKVAR